MVLDEKMATSVNERGGFAKKLWRRFKQVHVMAAASNKQRGHEQKVDGDELKVEQRLWSVDRRLSLMVANQPLENKERMFFDAIDPATEECVARIPEATKQDAEEAVALARRASSVWASMPVHERKVSNTRSALKKRMARTYALTVGSKHRVHSLAHAVQCGRPHGKACRFAGSSACAGPRQANGKCEAGDFTFREASAPPHSKRAPRPP